MADISKENPRAGRAGMVSRLGGTSEAERERKIFAGDFDSVFSCEYLPAEKTRLIVIVGPTGAGKTELALALAKKYNGEIIGADSRQVYKKLDIGTAKPKGVWRAGIYRVAGVPYHLVDIIEPDEPFTLADYKKLALQKINETIGRGQRPFLVGGTGLYVSAIVNNLDLPKLPPSAKLRREFEAKNLPELLTLLAKADPETFKIIDKKNKRRVTRALEVCLASGQPFSSQRQSGPPLFEVLQIGLSVPRQILYNRIEVRVEEMVKEGLVEEVKNLLKLGYSEALPALSAIGYREIIQFLKGEISLTQAIELISGNTRDYARRQLTWFKKDKTINWVSNQKEAEQLIKKFLK